MRVLITKQNETFFKELGIKKFEEASKNTSYFKCTEKKFLTILEQVRIRNINPYALMVW